MYNYDRNVVAAAYRAAHPDTLDAKEQTLVQFDADLYRMYDAEIRKGAGEALVPTDVFSRSWLVYYATRSTAKKVETRVRHAFAFYDSVRPRPSTIVETPVMVTPTPDDG